MLKDSEQGVRRVHPSQKPLALFSFVAEKYGKPNDLIIDPFLGSGMSLISAEQMEGDAYIGQRTVVAFELSEEYCEIVCQRFQSLKGVTPVKVGSINTCNNEPSPEIDVSGIPESLGF